MRCLAIRSLLTGGFPPDEHDPLADSLFGLPSSEIADALNAARAVARARTIDEARDASHRMTDLVRRLEADLGFTSPPASIRRDGGLFAALRLTRTLLPTNEAAGLPLAIPSGWRPKSEEENRG